jgi:hypothetical protein
MRAGWGLRLAVLAAKAGACGVNDKLFDSKGRELSDSPLGFPAFLR